MDVYGINGSDRDDYLSLVDFEDFRDAREKTQAASEEPGQSTIDELIEMIKRGYDEKDAALLASAFAADATLSGGELRGRQLTGSEEIRGHFEIRLYQADSSALVIDADERVVEGRLAYLRGSFSFSIGPRAAGRFLWVLRFSPELGWRIQSAAQLPLL
jgi:ketosteroid isomerase-like protein